MWKIYLIIIHNSSTCLMITFCGFCCVDDLDETNVDCWFVVVEDFPWRLMVGAGRIFVGDFAVFAGTIVTFDCWDVEDCSNLFSIIPYEKDKRIYNCYREMYTIFNWLVSCNLRQTCFGEDDGKICCLLVESIPICANVIFFVGLPKLELLLRNLIPWVGWFSLCELVMRTCWVPVCGWFPVNIIFVYTCKRYFVEI